MTSNQQALSPSAEHSLITALNQRHFDGELSTEFTEAFAALGDIRLDVIAYLERVFRLMNQGGFNERDLSGTHGHIFAGLVAGLLPDLTENSTPATTMAGRHQLIDEYLLRSNLLSPQQQCRMLDIGCGFPPLTTHESAERFPNWRIVGVDPSLPSYLIYDEDDNYATFDAQKNLLHFQPASASIAGWIELLQNSKRTQAHFRSLLVRLCSKAGATQAWDTRCVELNGGRMLVNPTMQYQRNNLSFVRAEIGADNLGSFDLVRCFNTLMFFDAEFVSSAHQWFEEVLNEGGVLLTGADWANTSECRYSTYRKEHGTLKPYEFAFSVDNLCPVFHTPWHALRDDDQQIELLSELLGTIRADRIFRTNMLQTSDRLRKEYEVCERMENGYYRCIDPDMSTDELWSAVSEVNQQLDSSGIVDQAVDVLRRSGYSARRNEVGHISIRQDS